LLAALLAWPAVADSDTVTELTEELRQMKIRIAGIYASDNGQPSGQAAKKTMAN